MLKLIGLEFGYAEGVVIQSRNILQFRNIVIFKIQRNINASLGASFSHYFH